MVEHRRDLRRTWVTGGHTARAPVRARPCTRESRYLTWSSVAGIAAVAETNGPLIAGRLGSVSSLEAVLGIVMLAGLVGVVVPVFPGLVLVAGAGLLWAFSRGGVTAWVVFGVMAAVGVAGMALASVLPARRAAAGGVPGWVLVAGAVGLVVGFFAIPVVGALIGFPAGGFVAELARQHHLGSAWRATWEALKGVGLGIALQLAAGVVMIAVWALAVFAT